MSVSFGVVTMTVKLAALVAVPPGVVTVIVPRAGAGRHGGRDLRVVDSREGRRSAVEADRAGAAEARAGQGHDSAHRA